MYVILDFVRGGLGIGLLSRWSVASYVVATHVVAICFSRAGLLEHWRASSRREARDLRHVKRFIELVGTLAAPRSNKRKRSS